MVILEDIIGLPFKKPADESQVGGHKTNIRYMDSIPIVELIPMRPSMHVGIHFLQLENAEKDYKSLLNQYKFDANLPLKYAFVIEGGINDSTSNNFGQTHLESFANFTSEGVFEATQILGVKSWGEVEKKLSNLHGAAKLPGMIAGKGVKALSEGINSLLGKNMGGLIKSLSMGHKVDFPNIWKGASTSMDYSVTIRLYNPNPADDKAFDKYILGPIVSLLLLALPITSPEHEETYQWPFYCQAKAPGLFSVKLGAIKDLSITKGGTAASFDYNQRPTMAEVRFTIGEVFDTRVIRRDGESSSLYPTLKDYIDALRGKKSQSHMRHFEHGNNSSESKILSRKETIEMIANIPKTKIKTNEVKDQRSDTLRNIALASNKEMADFMYKKLQEFNLDTFPDRDIVDQAEKDTENDLKFSEIEDTNVADEFIPIGEVSYLDDNNMEAIIDPLDFDNMDEAIQTAKKYEDQGYVSKFVEGVKNLPEELYTTVKDKVQEYSETIIDSNLHDVTTSIDNIIKIGTNTIIDLQQKVATLDPSDFANKYSALKRKKRLEKEGFQVNVINDPDNLMA